MKFNKKFLGIFLGLSMVFCSSVLVSARNIVEVEEDEIQSVEPCVEKADKKLAEYIKGSLKKGEKLTKNKFEEKKEKSVRLAEKNSEKQESKLEKLESLLKPLKKTSKKESAYKDIINFRIEETKEKIKDKVGYSEKERDYWKKELNRLKKLNQKEELSDLEKSGLKANLETSIIMTRNNMKESFRLAKKDSENQKLKLEKLESLLKLLKKTSKKESAYKDIINFRIEETKEKIKDKVGYSEKERDLLKKELEKLKKLSQKEELSDLEKSGLESNLETSIIMAKSDSNDVKKFKKDVEKVKYEATKKEIAKM